MTTETLTDNRPWAGAQSTLSVLVPFFRDDPGPLFALLEREAASLAGRVEIVTLDDGGGDAGLTARLADQIKALTL
ncbi:hypothetical protein ACNJUX_20975, partial [Mycobacterium tuberculosis]